MNSLFGDISLLYCSNLNCVYKTQKYKEHALIKIKFILKISDFLILNFVNMFRQQQQKIKKLK